MQLLQIHVSNVFPFPQKICCALISLIVFPEKMQSNCSYNLYSRMCICVCVLCVCIYCCSLPTISVCLWSSWTHWQHLILASYKLDCEISAPWALLAVLCNTSLVLDFIKISRRVAKYWCGRHICQFKLPSKAYRPCGRKLPYRTLRPLNC